MRTFHPQWTKSCHSIWLIALFFCSSPAQNGDQLIEAVMYQDLEKIQQLVASGTDINYRNDQSGATALILAANYGFTDIARYLIKSGADINLQDKNGISPLMAAAGASEEMFNLLIENEADVTLTNHTGTTAFTSSMTGLLHSRITFEVPEVLLKMGADVDESPTTGKTEGYTALMMAARNQRPDIVEFLLNHGADINATAKDGETPLSLAKKEDDAEMMRLLKKLGARE